MSGSWKFPAAPEVPAQQRASASFELRYDDLTQDGHVKLTALPNAIGRACFAKLWVHHPLLAVYQQGIVPILTRLVIESDPASTPLGAHGEADGTMELAHELDSAGQVSALVLNMAAEVRGPLGRSYGQQPPGAGSKVSLGRVFSEHVFTKPFAPAGERKVLRFDVPGQPAVPETRYQRRTLAELLQLPAAAQPLDEHFVTDPAAWVFGLTHTDNNQHVNSLVYPRLFEDAALRRLFDRGQGSRLLARATELVYRKPCFAGDRVVCSMRAFVVGETHGVVGYVGGEATAPERAHCAIRMLFRSA
jgi:hypothetical protein